MAASLRDKTQKYTRLQWWLLGGLVAFSGGFFLFVYRPADGRSDRLALQVDAQRQELQLARECAKDLPRIAAENEDLTLRLAKTKRLPKQTEWAEFIRDITRLSNQASLKKFKYTYGLARRSDLFAQFPIELEFEGDMPNAYSFLRQTEELPRLTRLRGIIIKTHPDKPGYVNVQMALNTYFSIDQ